ncbi:hypothetical protein GCM10020219_049630 [Nonomuraea dietziae]
MYQSGTEPAEICVGLAGPYSHMGAIWNPNPRMISMPNVARAIRGRALRRADTEAMNREWPCRRTRSSRAISSTAMTTAISRCPPYITGMILSPGKSGPNSSDSAQVPTKGMDCTTDMISHRLPPDNMSSGRALPVSPAAMPSASSVTQISH